MYNNSNTNSQEELTLSIEQPEKQLWWEKKGFIAASIFSVIWLAFVWDYIFLSGWWSTRHTLSPAEFIGGICGLFFPILLSFIISSYFDRASQIAYEAQSLRSFLGELIYPTNSNAVYTKSITNTLKEQVKEFKKVHQETIEATKNLNTEISSWIENLSTTTKQIEAQTVKNLKSLTESVSKLDKYSVEAGDTVTKSATTFNEQTIFLRRAVKEATQSFEPIISGLNQYGNELKKIETTLEKSDEKSALVLENTKKTADEINLKIKEIATVIQTYNEQAEKQDFMLKNRLEQTQSILEMQNQTLEKSESFAQNQETIITQIKSGLSDQTNMLDNAETILKTHQKNVEKTFAKTNEHLKNIEQTLKDGYSDVVQMSDSALSKIKTIQAEMKEAQELNKTLASPIEISHKQEAINEKKTPVDFLQNASTILDKLQTFSIDMAHIFTPKAEDMLWKKYYEGDKAVFMRYITRMMTETQHRQIKDLYVNNPDFNQAITRYMTEFEDMTKMVQNEDENKLLMSILIGSDIGRLYMVLADVLRREDD